MTDAVCHMGQYEFHPIAGIFPMIDGAESAQLAENVRTHGVREPIWLYEGKILDGRNRYLAAQAVGASFQTRIFEGDTLEAIDFVWSLNRTRRHLSSSQAAIADAKRNQMTDAYRVVRDAARERQFSTLKQNASTAVEQIPQREPAPKTRDIRARYPGAAPPPR